MKIAIMQPYFFPYAGYFSLISCVDKFVFYDDVSFIKNGWINRNRLLISGAVRYFTIPLCGASSNLKISEVVFQDKASWERKMLEGIRQSYAKAPFFKETFDLIREVLCVETNSISDVAKRSVRLTSERLGFSISFIDSSSSYNNSDLRGERRLIDICRKEGGSEYYNPVGGKKLYDPKDFLDANLKLSFVSGELKPYRQFDGGFQSGLSVLDMMMFNSYEACRELISEETC